MDRTALSFRPGVPGLIPDAWIIKSDQDTSAPAVVAVHGITRGVDEMVTHLLPQARRTGRTVVIPHFDKAHWPRYQRAACKNRSDWALIRLVTTLRTEDVVTSAPFDLSGFSGGAQFSHRFAWLYPDLVGRLCLTAPGWWTLPDPTIEWPYGMADAPHGSGRGFQLQSNLHRFLDRQIAVCVGSDDIARDANLRTGADIDRLQGANRFERARTWAAKAAAVACAAGVSPKISLRVLQGCGHSFVECVTHAGLDHDFIAPAPRDAGCNNAAVCKAARSQNTLERTAA